MELRQLHYFSAIARLGGFRRAAADLDVSQPALSQQIKLLEQELGMPLFERGQRQVSLTTAGVVLLERAEHALAELRKAREELRELAADCGQVNVGVLSPSGMVWVPRLLAAFKRQHPHIGVTLVERSSEQLLTLLEDGRVHAAWLVWPTYEEPPPGLHLERLFTGELVFAVSPQHPLAGRSRVSLAELASEQLILPPPAEPIRDIVDRAFKARGLAPTVAVELSDQPMRIELVAHGLGVAIASESYVTHVAQSRVAMLKVLDHEPLRISWVLACAIRGVRTSALRTFLEFSDAQMRAWVRDGAVLTRIGWDIGSDSGVPAGSSPPPVQHSLNG